MNAIHLPECLCPNGRRWLILGCFLKVTQDRLHPLQEFIRDLGELMFLLLLQVKTESKWDKAVEQDSEDEVNGRYDPYQCSACLDLEQKRNRKECF